MRLEEYDYLVLLLRFFGTICDARLTVLTKFRRSCELLKLLDTNTTAVIKSSSALGPPQLQHVIVLASVDVGRAEGR